MLSSLLKSEDDFGGASYKWFLVSFLLNYGSSREVERSITSFSKDLGFSKGLVLNSLSTLVKFGFLSRRASRTGRGRPVGIYSVTDRLLGLAVGEDCALDFLSMVNVLLSIDSGFFDCKGVRFGASSKLLLSVLVCHANRHGIVEHVGTSLLCKQAGMSVEQLRKQIDRLVLFGVIRSVVQGCCGKYLFGQVENVYALNLHSDVFDKITPPSMTIAFDLQAEHHWAEGYEIKRFCSDLAKAVQMDGASSRLMGLSAVDRILGSSLESLLREERDFIFIPPNEARSADQISGVDYLPIRSWYTNLRSGSAHLSYLWLTNERGVLFARLQLLIDECTSMLLSEGWECFSRSEADPDIACEAELAVYQKIKKELFSTQVLRDDACGASLIESLRDDLICLIFLMSRQSARRVHGFLQDTGIKELSSYAYRILPVPRPHEIRYGWLLEAVPKTAGLEVGGEHLFNLEHGVKVVKNDVGSLAGLSLERLVRLGLRSKSKRSG